MYKNVKKFEDMKGMYKMFKNAATHPAFLCLAVHLKTFILGT